MWLSTLVLPHHRVAVRMHGTFGQASVVVVLKMHGMLLEVRRKQAPVDWLARHSSGWALSQQSLTVEASTALSLYVLLAYSAPLFNRQLVIHGRQLW